MNFIKIVIVSIIVIVQLVGNLLNAQVDSTELKRFKERRLTRRVLQNALDYNSISYKIDAKINTGEKSYNLNIIFRNAKDSVIWINANHNTGIPVARFLIDKDSTRFLNRIDNKYLLSTNDELKNLLNYDLDFEMIQSIFTAGLLNPEPEKDPVQVFSRYNVYRIDSCYVMQNIKKKKLERLTKKNKIDEYFLHQVTINEQFIITGLKVEDNVNLQKIEIFYKDYTELENGKMFPQTIEIIARNEKGTTTINLELKKIKVDQDDLDYPFKVPEKYTAIDLRKTEEN
ncbi:MAG: DUF4292 domain-containing protein [Bacteroidales bacterium]|nr:DUF4292 domain-containing protein [Bacteroidales bacterium]